MYLLSILVFLPLLGALGILVLPENRARSAKQLAMVVSILTFVISLGLLAKFDGNTYAFQLEEKKDWITQLGIGYHLGLDGISLWLVLLTTFLSIVAVACSLKTTEFGARPANPVTEILPPPLSPVRF